MYINETFKVSFEANFSQFEKEKDFRINIKCLIIVPEFVYNYYLFKNINNQSIFNSEIYEENSENENEKSDYMEYKIILSESDIESEDKIRNNKNTDSSKDENNKENKKVNKKKEKQKKV